MREDTDEVPIVRIGPGKTSTFFSSEAWESSGARPEVVDALASIGVTRPSHIQAESFRALSGGAPHVALADRAGSGKTLAYLVPVLQALKEEEAILGAPPALPHCPRILVVAPTSELCVQVLRVCRALSKRLKFRSGVLTGGRPLKTQKDMLKNGLDVAIGTPGRLAELVNHGAMSLDRCSTIVFDEVDVLLGESSLFEDHVTPLVEAATKRSARCVLVSATLPSDVYASLELRFPGLVAVVGPGLHRTAPGVVGNQRKCAALFAALQENPCARTMVFCNKIETCRTVENFLVRSLFDDSDHDKSTIRVLPYHAAIRSDIREANLARFLSLPERDGDALDAKGRKKSSSSSGQRMILICTDRASRGIDSAFVDHVVLFDFPRDPSEYVRRVGRTARGAGGRGVVTILVLGRQVRIAKDVVGRNQKDLPVHPVPSAIPVSSIPKRSQDVERFLEDLGNASSKHGPTID